MFAPVLMKYIQYAIKVIKNYGFIAKVIPSIVCKVIVKSLQNQRGYAFMFASRSMHEMWRECEND